MALNAPAEVSSPKIATAARLPDRWRSVLTFAAGHAFNRTPGSMPAVPVRRPCSLPGYQAAPVLQAGPVNLGIRVTATYSPGRSGQVTAGGVPRRLPCQHGTGHAARNAISGMLAP